MWVVGIMVRTDVRKVASSINARVRLSFSSISPQSSKLVPDVSLGISCNEARKLAILNYNTVAKNGTSVTKCSPTLVSSMELNSTFFRITC